MKRSGPILRKSPLKRRASPIRKVSRKRAVQNTAYAKVRSEFLVEHPWCELFCAADGIRTLANQVHHRLGRRNTLLCDTRFFSAACGDCHPRRCHETDVALAKKLGFHSA